MTKGKKWVNWTKFKTNTIMSSLKNKIKLKKEIKKRKKNFSNSKAGINKGKYSP